MGKRRGFFAEIAYQNQQTALRQQRANAAATRAHAAAVREQERHERAYEQACRAAELADTREKARLEKEAAKAHTEARVAEVAARNLELASIYDEIDGLLAATLDVDDYVDLESLKVVPQHPAFAPGVADQVAPDVATPNYPPAPTYEEPAAARGLFASKKKHAEQVEQAQAAHTQAHAQWDAYTKQMAVQYTADVQRRDEVEAQRLETLSGLKAQYEKECAQRETDAAARNEELTKLINDLAFDVEAAVQEYVGIVLSNSAYPESFPVEHDYEFDVTSRELTLAVTVPPPDEVPAVKEYRYVKSKDEVTETALPAKARKDRYSEAVLQVALRTIHEVFEADRNSKIRTISLTVGSNAIDPATGITGLVPFVIVAAGRQQFTEFDLANVVPKATLEHLGASLSKSPLDLVAADTSRGVRVRNT